MGGCAAKPPRARCRGVARAMAAAGLLPRRGRFPPGAGRLLRTMAAVCLVVLPLPLAAQSAHCRQALALGLDVSGSVSAAEYRLQLDGLAAALTHPDVRQALLSVPDLPVRLLVYEWSGPEDQHILIDWIEIGDDGTLATIASRLRATTRTPANPTTALGTTMLFGAGLLNKQRSCWRLTLDISGDGRTNTGPRPQDVNKDPVLDGITINALVIGSDHPDGGVPVDEIEALRLYFELKVIRGPDAFTEVALGFADYEDAMVRKLLRETEGLAIGQLSRQSRHSGPAQ